MENTNHELLLIAIKKFSFDFLWLFAVPPGVSTTPAQPTTTGELNLSYALFN